MRDFIISLFAGIIRSIFVSAILFVVGFSVITGKFPPDFSKLSNIPKQIQQLTAVNKKIFEKEIQLKAEQQQNGFVEDAEVEQLQRLQLERAEIGSQFIAGENSPKTNSDNPTSTSKDKELIELKKRVELLENKVHRLEGRFRDTK